jgi:hypothetical protein
MKSKADKMEIFLDSSNWFCILRKMLALLFGPGDDVIGSGESIGGVYKISSRSTYRKLIKNSETEFDLLGQNRKTIEI